MFTQLQMNLISIEYELAAISWLGRAFHQMASTFFFQSSVESVPQNLCCLFDTTRYNERSLKYTIRDVILVLQSDWFALYAAKDTTPVWALDQALRFS